MGFWLKVLGMQGEDDNLQPYCGSVDEWQVGDNGEVTGICDVPEVGTCRNCGRELLYNVSSECCAGCYGQFMRKIDHRIKHHRY